MSLKKYKALVETIDLGSLTKAAEKLNYTQPGVSHMILSLENEFGFPLLIRGKNGVTPTPEAEKLMVYLRQIVNGEEKLKEEVNRIHGADVGTIRIGCFFSLSQPASLSRNREKSLEVGHIGHETDVGDAQIGCDD